MSEILRGMTPDDARRAVYDALAGEFRGTLAVGAVREDAESFAVEYGHKEEVVDGDLDYMLLDPPVALVDKQAGTVTFVPVQDDEARFQAMTEV